MHEEGTSCPQPCPSECERPCVLPPATSLTTVRHGLAKERSDGRAYQGVLEDWDTRGVVLRHTKDMVSLTASRVEDVPSEPMM